MVGATVEVIKDMEGEGVVRYGGELWNARTSWPLHAGQPARVIRVEGLVLFIEPASSARE